MLSIIWTFLLISVSALFAFFFHKQSPNPNPTSSALFLVNVTHRNASFHLTSFTFSQLCGAHVDPLAGSQECDFLYFTNIWSWTTGLRATCSLYHCLGYFLFLRIGAPWRQVGGWTNNNFNQITQTNKSIIALQLCHCHTEETRSYWLVSLGWHASTTSEMIPPNLWHCWYLSRPVFGHMTVRSFILGGEMVSGRPDQRVSKLTTALRCSAVERRRKTVKCASVKLRVEDESVLNLPSSPPLCLDGAVNIFNILTSNCSSRRLGPSH